MSEQRTRMIWSNLSFDAVSPEIPYKLNIRQFVCTILSINKTRAEEDVRIRADSWWVCPFLFKPDQAVIRFKAAQRMRIVSIRLTCRSQKDQGREPGFFIYGNIRMV